MNPLLLAIMLMTMVACGTETAKTDGSNKKEENRTNAVGSEQDSHAWVDLGLPSGTLWATCNIGANKPEEYGDYFAWGETYAKSNYDWNSYKYCKGDSQQITKYCNKSRFGFNGYTDNLIVLQPFDDAATVNWDNDWRMPTWNEWEELYKNTRLSWTSQNRVQGLLFTAANGQSLFLPAAGNRWYGKRQNNGGCYWASSLYDKFDPNNGLSYSFSDDPDCAEGLSFDASNCSVSCADRALGCPVRPVRSAK